MRNLRVDSVVESPVLEKSRIFTDEGSYVVYGCVDLEICTMSVHDSHPDPRDW